MNEYIITGVDIDYSQRFPFFNGFRLKDVCGSVDPFVGAEMQLPQHLLDMLDEYGMYAKTGKEKDFSDGIVQWAKDQIGKTLICESLTYSAFATNGKTSIV